MERITSRKNQNIVHMRALGCDNAFRRETQEFLCEGEKLLREALQFDAIITCVLWPDEPIVDVPGAAQFIVPADILNSVSPLKTTRGPIFSVRFPVMKETHLRNAIILENVQDPGNVGTVIRTASAFGIDAVILVGECADPFNFKTVRSTMGAIFRQKIITTELNSLLTFIRHNDLVLYGAALSECASDIRSVNLDNAAVAIGSEGHGLSSELLALCDGQIIIPMMPHSESLNAAVAASLSMWKMKENVLPKI